jgi:hypothetical protein
MARTVVVVETREEPTYAAKEEWMFYRKVAGKGDGWQPQRNQPWLNFNSTKFVSRYHVRT